MTESMVERVARIIEPQAWTALGLCDTLAYKARRTSSLRKARAIIAAMREPTRSMTEHPSYINGEWSRRTVEAYIDAALSEEKETAE